MATGSPTPTHPLLTCVEAIEDALHEVTGADGSPAPDPDFLPLDDRVDYLVRLDRIEAGVAALKARALAGAAALADRDGFKDPGAWLAAATTTTPARARAAFRLGTRLLRRPATASAWGLGLITSDHAAAVVASVDALPASLGAELIGSVETTLLGYCREHTPPEIRRLGVRALEAVAPDEADAIIERLLAAEEGRARRKTVLHVRDRGDGTASIRGVITSLAAAVLNAALDAYTNPRRACLDHDEGGVHEPAREPDEGAGDPEVDRLSFAQKRGRAFCALVEHLPTAGLPVSGGTPVHVAVTISGERLDAEAGAAFVDESTMLSTGEVRRLLCQHGVFPLVLDGESTVLDVGRLKRIYPAEMIRAKRVVQQTCRVAGCTVPSRWCEAHHRVPWAAGGLTRLVDLVLLCLHHHQRVHDRAFDVHYDVRGQVTLTRINRRT